jgi:fused signal recognition particle receptor
MAEQGWRGSIARGLTRTRELLLTDVGDLFTDPGRTEEDLDRLEDHLLEADLGVETAARVREQLAGMLHRGKGTDSDEVLAVLEEVIAGLLAPYARPRDLAAPFPHRPHVVLVVGVNGSGKTTTIGKLAHGYVRSGRKVLLAAADTYRAAAVEQLAHWAERVGAGMVRSQTGQDPAAVAVDALAAARAREADLLLVDTAGRLHTRTGLMDELAKIRRVLADRMEGAPHETLLVLDAVTGQNALAQVEQFGRATPLTGLVLTKLDGTTRGGIVVPITTLLGLPVELIGVGEGLDDLRPFDARACARALTRGEDD